jgi:hypothetical protein
MAGSYSPLSPQRGRQPRPVGRSSQQEGWMLPLPDESRGHFEAAAHELETALGMVSVALDEAVELRMAGQLGGAREQARCTAQLLERLKFRILRTLEALGEFGSAPRLSADAIPEVNAIHAAFFRHPEAHRIAVWQGCLFWVLYGARLRFQHKVRALDELVRQLCATFRSTAEDLADGTCVSPLESWELLEVLHFDLNTCVQEVIVLLKSLFRALPETAALTLREKILPDPPPSR